MAGRLGVELMEWQTLATDVGLEVADDGHFAFQNVTCTTPRQQGKSVLMLAVLLHRMLSEPHQRVMFGAQSRLVARTRLLDCWWPIIQRSRLRGLFRVSRGTGMESLRATNGSILTLLSSDETAGHGESLDCVVLDECWSLDASTEQAVLPTLLTKPDGQMWLVSTAGHERSVWWYEKCMAGRTAVSTGGDSGVAYLEWSADPSAEPGDPETWRSCMPALGVTCMEKTVRADLAVMPPAEFKRAFLNLWPSESDSGWKILSREAWRDSLL